MDRTGTKDKPSFKIALISPPWYTVETACIQLETLKASLAQNAPDARVDLFHWYLDVADALTPRLYYCLQRTSLPVLIATAVLNGQKIDRNILADTDNFNPYEKKKLLREIAKAGGLGAIRKSVEKVLKRLIASVDWKQYRIVGFSNSYSQLFFSVHMAREIKKTAPGVVTVFGGNECFGETGTSLLNTYPFIDKVVIGAGENTLLDVIKDVQSRKSGAPAVYTEIDPKNAFKDPPIPAYDDYYAHLAEFPDVKKYIEFAQVLLVEMGRGCYWNRPVRDTACRGCTFCGEKSLWSGYAAKSNEDLKKELIYLTQKYMVTSVFLIDCAISPKKLIELLEDLNRENIHLEILVGLRADVARDDLIRLKQLGVTSVTFGFESFSNSLLNKINKGTDVLHNIYAMKICEEMGLRYFSCVILYYPDATRQDIEENIDAMKFVSQYRALSNCKFSLLSTSPLYKLRDQFDLRNVKNHRYYETFLTKREKQNLLLYRKEFKEDRALLPAWQKLEKLIQKWQRHQKTLRKNYDIPSLRMHRIGPSLKIIQRSMVSSRIKETKYYLKDAAARIYDFCYEPRRISEIRSELRLDKAQEGQIGDYLRDLIGKRLMYASAGRYLSLAVDAKGLSTTRSILF